jgi:Zn-dependent protease
LTAFLRDSYEGIKAREVPPIDFMRWTFPMFRIFGIPVRMHWFLLIIILGRIVQGWSQAGVWGLEWMTITMVILLISILFHELAHCWMGIRLGGHAESIMLWPLGGLATIDHTGRPAEQIKISGIGPISSFVLGGICAGILLATGAPWSWSYLNPWDNWWPRELAAGVGETMFYVRGFLLHAVRLNLLLGLFNLVIPAYPLDGGQVVFSFLALRYDRVRAAQLLSTISMPIGIALGVWGIAQEEFNLILIGAWILIEAFRLRVLVRTGELEQHPAFGGGGREFEYMPDRPKKKGWFARWRENRARKAMAREAERDDAMKAKVDAVLDKVSREGIGSLSAAEKKILDDASRRGRGG